MSLSIIYVTFPSLNEAKKTAEEAVSIGKAACVNILPGISSIYKWEDKVETADEYAAIFKTSQDLCAELVEWIKTKHSYETPAIIVFSAETTTEFFAYITQHCS